MQPSFNFNLGARADYYACSGPSAGTQIMLHSKYAEVIAPAIVLFFLSIGTWSEYQLNLQKFYEVDAVRRATVTAVTTQGKYYPTEGRSFATRIVRLRFADGVEVSAICRYNTAPSIGEDIEVVGNATSNVFAPKDCRQVQHLYLFWTFLALGLFSVAGLIRGARSVSCKR